jgi:serine/threonine protein kinase
MQEGKLGQDQDIFLTDSLDTWANEVRGSSARVFLGTYRHTNGFKRMAAFKFMRPPETEAFDIIEYARPMFIEEVPILYQLRDVPGVMKMIEMGFLQIVDNLKIPSDSTPGTGRHLAGDLIRLTPDETEIYLEQIESKIADDWVPYLLLERFYPEENLLRLCDINLNRGNYFPIEKGLACAVQACQILQFAHENNIVYRDHKIVHYYWNDVQKKLSMIDWNVAKRHLDGVSQHEIIHDLALFASRALHYILTGRPSYGALAATSRTEEVEQAAASYHVHFTYEDRKHLNKDVRDVLAKALMGKYDSASFLSADIKALLVSLQQTW